MRLSGHTRHILSLSGGKDSAALAVFMRDRVAEMEYVFHDSGKELPETYEYLERLESYLGKEVHRTTPPDSFDHWLKVYGNMLPSNHRRWCTKMLKLKPFEDYVGCDEVLNYVGLRADEDRDGYLSTKPNIRPVYPFREHGLVLADIYGILRDSGLGLPKYTDWGRSRSGCFFCFYQQKIEWVRLKENYPDLFEQAKEYEARSIVNGQPFYWCANESLASLEDPRRTDEIKRNWEAAESRRKARRKNLSLLQVLGGGEIEDNHDDGCLICTI